MSAKRGTAAASPQFVECRPLKDGDLGPDNNLFCKPLLPGNNSKGFFLSSESIRQSSSLRLRPIFLEIKYLICRLYLFFLFSLGVKVYFEKVHYIVDAFRLSIEKDTYNVYFLKVFSFPFMFSPACYSPSLHILRQSHQWHSYII